MLNLFQPIMCFPIIPLLIYNVWICEDNAVLFVSRCIGILAVVAFISKDYRLGALVFCYKKVKSLDLEHLLKRTLECSEAMVEVFISCTNWLALDL